MAYTRKGATMVKGPGDGRGGAPLDRLGGPLPRPVTLTGALLARVAALAARRGGTRSAVLRACLRDGLAAWGWDDGRA